MLLLLIEHEHHRSFCNLSHFLSLHFFPFSEMPSATVDQALAIYSKGTKAWFADEQEGWVSASVNAIEKTDTHVKITFINDTDETKVQPDQFITYQHT